MVPALSLKEKKNHWAQELSPSSLTVSQLGTSDIDDILTLQAAVADSKKHSIDRLFLKQRNAQSYQTILDDGGVIFGVKKDGFLIASSCINNALGQGRVEIVIDQDKQSNAAVFQGTMAHPDIKGLDYRLADILYIKRMEWAFENNKTDVYASVCSSVYNPVTSLYPTNPNNKTDNPNNNGNLQVINGLVRKKFAQNANSQIMDRGFRLNIMTLGFTLPETRDTLNHHMRDVVREDIANQWISKPALKLL